MDELSPEARAALDAFRHSESPSDSHTRAQWRALDVSIAAGAMPQLAALTSVAASTTQTAALAKGAGLLGTLKGVLLGAALGTGAVTAFAYAMEARREVAAEQAAAEQAHAKAPETPKPRVEFAVPPTSDTSEATTDLKTDASPEPTAPRVVVPASPEKSRPTPRSAGTSRVEDARPPSPRSTLSEELSWLQRAQGTTGRGRLDVLDAYSRKFAHGDLEAEAQLLRAKTLCELGETERLRSLVKHAEEEGTSAPRLERLRRICKP